MNLSHLGTQFLYCHPSNLNEHNKTYQNRLIAPKKTETELLKKPNLE